VSITILCDVYNYHSLYYIGQQEGICSSPDSAKSLSPMQSYSLMQANLDFIASDQSLSDDSQSYKSDDKSQGASCTPSDVSNCSSEDVNADVNPHFD
jgi:hypothetical protein